MKRVGKWVGDYLTKHLSKDVRAACLKGKRLWATFGGAVWCRVKDIRVRSRLGKEYRRLRGGLEQITREQRYGILKDAQINYMRWVNGTNGLETWRPPGPPALPEQPLGIPY